jgi:phenylalanyl-tRNA synthetase alpha chain
LSLFFTDEQKDRLRDLGASSEELTKSFSSAAERDEVFLSRQKSLASLIRKKLDKAFLTGGRPAAELLRESLASLLASLGLTEVSTPIIMSRARLVKMGLEDDPLLTEQVFWIDPKRCLRPMLAPHLYEYMLDIQKLRRDKTFGIFEIGPCFRKESQGARHAGEFTMLNLVEVNVPLERRQARLEEFIGLIAERANLKDWRLEIVESTVYGQTVDLVDGNGLELASCSMGPHPLDKAWGFAGTWIGLGLGLERLAMSLAGSDRLSPVGRGFGRLLGLPLSL